MGEVSFPFEFVPLDKSYYIRLGVLDLIAVKDDVLGFLSTKSDLSADLYSVLHLGVGWTESATLFRFMTFARWKFGREDWHIEKVGTLSYREICNDPSIVDLSQEALLKLDNGTSQWASAAAICGDPRRIDGAPVKLLLTYEAIEDWKKGCWGFRPDPTIFTQMSAFAHFVGTGQMEFTATHSEDYCFARAFGLMGATEAESRWPSLKGHESNRIEEMECMLHRAGAGKTVGSNDHRVVQALAMRWPEAKFTNPDCVDKSCPRFWEYLKFVTMGW